MSEPSNSFFEIFKNILPYLSTLVLASWGGAVAYIQNMRTRKSLFSWRELSFDLFISTFAGLLTFFFCLWAETEPAVTAMLTATSGHMGARTIAKFEVIHEKWFDKGR